MRSSKLLLSTLFVLIATASRSYSETPNPVVWAVQSAPHGSVKPGSRFSIKIIGTIQPGWHIYAMEEPDGSPMATQVGITESDPARVLRITASKPQLIHDAALNLTAGVYLNSAAFILYLQVDSTSSQTPLHILVRYQSCNNKLCFPPRTQTIEVPLRIGE